MKTTILALGLFCLFAVAGTAFADVVKPKAIPAPEDVAAAPKGALESRTGLKSKVLQEGTGDSHPGPNDIVTVHYTGWQTDGKMFDSSVARDEEISFPLNRVIAGWTEGLQLMVEGEKRRFWIPERLAYGGKRPPYGMLVFDVELISFEEAPKPPPVPADVAAPPEDASFTDSGIGWRILQEGTGTIHPKPTDSVTVHYTGWATNGMMFDSSITRGAPATFALNRVIRGWTEGVQLMVVGEKRRFWIPERLAYQGRSEPYGMLVFDIELLDIR